jgi:hypothetical protein
MEITVVTSPEEWATRTTNQIGPIKHYGIEEEKMKRTFPAKNGWQDALQKLREENAALNTEIDDDHHRLASLTTDYERLRMVLREIARQRIKKELTESERDNADYEYGFEYTVENARKALEPAEPGHECEYEMGHCVICGEDMSGCKQTEGGGE